MYTYFLTNSKLSALLDSWWTILQLGRRVNPHGGTTSVKLISLPGLCTIVSNCLKDKFTTCFNQYPQNACTNFQYEISAVLGGHFTQIFGPNAQLASFNSIKNLISVCRDTPGDTRDCLAGTDMFYLQRCTEVYSISQKACDQSAKNTRSMLL